MIVYDPTGTIFRVIAISMLEGGAWAALAAYLIYIGSTLLSPRIPPARIWADWRRKRMIWGVSLTLSALGQFLLSEWIGRKIGLIDLYWAARPEALLWICRLTATFGYLLVCFFIVLVGVLRRRKAGRPPAPSRPKPR